MNNKTAVYATREEHAHTALLNHLPLDKKVALKVKHILDDLTRALDK